MPPELQTETIVLKDETHQSVTISDYKGKYILVSYFQTWCGDCIQELKSIDDLQIKAGKENIKIIMISDEPWTKISRFKEKYCNTLDYYQSKESLRSQGIHIFPTTFLLDRNGNTLISKTQRFDWSSDDVLKRIK